MSSVFERVSLPLRRHLLTAVVALATPLAQWALIRVETERGHHLHEWLGWGNLVGGLVCVALFYSGRLNLLGMGQVMVPFVALAYALYLGSALVGGYPPEASSNMILLMLALLSFTVQTWKVAWLIVGLGWLALVLQALTHSPVDTELLVYTTFLLLLIGYLSRYGVNVQSQTARADHMAELALMDAMTGLPNRRAAQHDLQAAWQERHTRNALVVIADIDDFKSVNDTYGHDTGDQVIRDVGQRLRGSVRPSDSVYRWGGEEYLLLLPDQTMEHAPPLLERLGQAVKGLQTGKASAADASGETESIRVTASAGAAALTEAESLEAVLRLADKRMYAAKHARHTQQ